MTDLYLGIETGGTKVVAAVGRVTEGGPELVAPEIVVPTSHEPETMLDGLYERVTEIAAPTDLRAVGVGAFGPVDPKTGTMLDTPKPGWAGFGLGAAVQRRWDLPMSLDTDVNAAGLAEWRWGAAAGTDVAVYLTVGTGIGGGLIVGGAPVRGLLHPEMGHIWLPRHPDDLGFPGACGAHGACFEGLAAGPAIRRRWGVPGEELPDDHPAWDLEAWYLGRGLAQIALSTSPEVVVLGGGVGGRDLQSAVEASLQEAIGGYVPVPRLAAPHCGSRAGVMGALALAAEAVE